MNNLNNKKMGKEEKEARSFQKRMKLWKSVLWDIADEDRSQKFWHQCYNNLFYLLDELNKEEIVSLYKGLSWITDTNTTTKKEIIGNIQFGLDAHSNGMCPSFDMSELRTRLFFIINNR